MSCDQPAHEVQREGWQAWVGWLPKNAGCCSIHAQPPLPHSYVSPSSSIWKPGQLTATHGGPLFRGTWVWGFTHPAPLRRTWPCNFLLKLPNVGSIKQALNL